MPEVVLALGEPKNPLTGETLKKGETHILYRWMGHEELLKLFAGEDLVPFHGDKWFLGGINTFYFYEEKNGGFDKLSKDVWAFGDVTPNTYFVEFETEYELTEHSEDEGLYMESLISYYNSSILRPVRYCRAYDLEWKFGIPEYYDENWIPAWFPATAEYLPVPLEEPKKGEDLERSGEERRLIKLFYEENAKERRKQRRGAGYNKRAIERWL